MPETTVEIFSDGACSGNPGPGGYGAILRWNGKEKELSGGEKLFCEYDQQVKHYPEKRGIVHNEILLPANAPPEYADRNTLWNAAEAVEKQWNSQLARRWVLSIPREIPPDQYAALVRDFCRQQFVSKGMCVDFAIHDKGDGNPHAHVMLTMRAMDERGKWLRLIEVRPLPLSMIMK